MQRLGLPSAPIRLLCIGAHPDDIEIGAGGTISRLAGDGRLAAVDWLVLTGAGARVDEARKGAAAFLDGGPAATLHLESFRDGFLPTRHADVKEAFEALKARVHPDLILTHRREDLHQDHRLVAELTWNTFRDHLILEYEIPKYEGDLGTPNVFVPLPAGGIERKIERLLDTFESQRGRDWFEPEVFRGLARIRGMECRAESGYAEAFTGRKLTL
jgi:LmbE family N-acetylglucosaminyl deacetylase